ncbi:MAG: neprosin family prolyl endopeptidase [Planctomycetes bacterium]|nr:neprosin family prolyl endopeptidase [Planctomycetota bacterium]
MPDFVSFNEFLDQTAAAKIDHHHELISQAISRLVRMGVAPPVPISDDVIEAEFTKMKNYVLGIYKHVTNVQRKHTFVGFDGSFHDCILHDQQPTYISAKNKGLNVSVTPPVPAAVAAGGAAAPQAMMAHANSVAPPLLQGFLDLFGTKIACPEDRVPMRRVTIARMARLGKFENYFRKPPNTPPLAGQFGSTEIHHHAVCAVTNSPNYYGCSTFLNVWQVNPAPGVFSLSQLWLEGTSTSGRIQTVESGWQTYPTLWGTAPALFVYYNPNGYDPSTSGYVQNQNNEGFILKPNSGWIVGGGLPGPYSTANGTQFGLNMQWQIDAGNNWWLYLGPNGQPVTPVGYFPAGLYQGTLANAATTLQFGGEVSSQDPGGANYPATGPMGSGIAPSGDTATDFRRVAFQKQISVQTTAQGTMVPAQLQVQSSAGDAGYRATQVSNSGSANWGSFMFFGGAHSA